MPGCERKGGFLVVGTKIESVFIQFIVAAVLQLQLELLEDA